MFKTQKPKENKEENVWSFSSQKYVCLLSFGFGASFIKIGLGTWPLDSNDFKIPLVPEGYMP